jgi:glycosyl hydrolase family 42 (putative beta-galactosidase)
LHWPPESPLLLNAKVSRRQLLGGLGVAVVAGAGAAFLLTRRSAEAPAVPVRTPTPMPSGTSSGNLAVYAFATGGHVMNAQATVDSLVHSSFTPKGVEWVIGWGLLRPTPGAYNWSLIDNALGAAARAGLDSQLAVVVGEFEPTWVVDACPQVVCPFPSRAKAMAVPVSSEYLSLLSALIHDLGVRYGNDSRLVSIQASGLGGQGEMYLWPDKASFWETHGVTAATLLPAWQKVIGEWHSAFPHTPISISIEEPLEPTGGVLEPLLAWMKAEYESRQWVQNNGLNPTTSTERGYGADLVAASQYTTVGWQMYGVSASPSVLEQSLHACLPAHPRFVQVYLEDLLRPTNLPALQSVAAV